jgi:hypothetical protein
MKERTKMRKKIISCIIICALVVNSSFVFAMTSYAKGSSPGTSSRSGSFSSKGSTFQNSPKSQSNSGSTSSGGFSGGSSGKVTSPSSGSTSGTTNSSKSNGFSGGSSNKSNVSNSGRTYYGGSTYTNSPPVGYRTSHFWPVVGAFAAGSLLGSMIHPWGGYYPVEGGGYIHQPFSFLTIIMDIVILLIAIWLIVTIVRLFSRRRSY